MINNILDILPGDGSSYAGQTQSSSNYYFDNFGEAALYALIGFAVVFVGIVIIIAVIWLVGFIMRKTDNLAFLTNWKNNKSKKQSDKSNEVLAKPDNNIVNTDQNDIPDEVKAAIVAAIMAYYEQEQAQSQKCQFVVKRIKRIN
jgi:Na+-transporting methylmalonyl-CoA/oxaloacetate decarboxylase gamma subunit